MKWKIAMGLIMINLSILAQPKKDSIKHDTATVFIQTMYDTLKAKFYYEDGNSLKIYRNGIIVRQIQTNSSNQNLNRVLSVIYYDEKMNKFLKPVYQVFQQN